MPLAGVRAWTWLLRTAALLVLMGYTRGKKRCTGLAQKLGRRLLFSHILPLNGLCMYGSFRVVSATPPSIVIETLVLGVRSVCARALC